MLKYYPKLDELLGIESHPIEVDDLPIDEAQVGELNSFFGKHHTEDSIKRMVAKRRENGTYKNLHGAKPVTYNGVTYESETDMRRKLNIGRWRQKALLSGKLSDNVMSRPEVYEKHKEAMRVYYASRS
jgi:hypothetical protein